MVDWLPGVLNAIASLWGWVGSALVPLLLPLVPVLALLWAVQSYRRSGSVVRVELELGKLDAAGRLIRGGAADWKDGKDPAGVLGVDVDAMHVDVAAVTVRNLGRTPTTVTDVVLFLGREKGHPIHYGGTLMKPGETEGRQRIEAHDSRLFVFPVWALVEQARADLGRKKLTARAQVKTGTGHLRRSSLRTRWQPSERGHLGAAEPGLGAQLLREFLTPGMELRDLAGEIAMTMQLVKTGANEVDVMEAIGDPRDRPDQAMRLMLIAVKVKRAHDAQAAEGAQAAQPDPVEAPEGSA